MGRGGSKEERITGTLLFSCPSSAGIAEGRFLGRMKLEEPKESQRWPRISSQPREGQGQSPGQRQALQWRERREGNRNLLRALLIHITSTPERGEKGRGGETMQCKSIRER